jgi:hypothetical protein
MLYSVDDDIEIEYGKVCSEADSKGGDDQIAVTKGVRCAPYRLGGLISSLSSKLVCNNVRYKMKVADRICSRMSKALPSLLAWLRPSIP